MIQKADGNGNGNGKHGIHVPAARVELPLSPRVTPLMLVARRNGNGKNHSVIPVAPVVLAAPRVSVTRRLLTMIRLFAALKSRRVITLPASRGFTAGDAGLLQETLNDGRLSPEMIRAMLAKAQSS